MRDWRRVAVGD